MTTGPDANAPDAAPVPATRGPIIIARHGKPALDRNAGPRLSWAEYIAWWSRYEDGSLEVGQEPPARLVCEVADAEILLSSPRPRAKETAAQARPDGEFLIDPLFIEAPLPPPRWKNARFLPKTWNVLARTAWSYGHAIDGSETISQSRQRAREAALRLHDHAARGKVFLAAHGWFNRMMRPELKKLGWVCTHDGGDKYWSYRKYEYRGRGSNSD